MKRITVETCSIYKRHKEKRKHIIPTRIYIIEVCFWYNLFPGKLLLEPNYRMHCTLRFHYKSAIGQLVVIKMFRGGNAICHSHSPVVRKHGTAELTLIMPKPQFFKLEN